MQNNIQDKGYRNAIVCRVACNAMMWTIQQVQESHTVLTDCQHSINTVHPLCCSASGSLIYPSLFGSFCQGRAWLRNYVQGSSKVARQGWSAQKRKRRHFGITKNWIEFQKIQIQRKKHTLRIRLLEHADVTNARNHKTGEQVGLKKTHWTHFYDD